MLTKHPLCIPWWGFCYLFFPPRPSDLHSIQWSNEEFVSFCAHPSVYVPYKHELSTQLPFSSGIFFSSPNRSPYSTHTIPTKSSDTIFHHLHLERLRPEGSVPMSLGCLIKDFKHLWRPGTPNSPWQVHCCIPSDLCSNCKWSASQEVRSNFW